MMGAREFDLLLKEVEELEAAAVALREKILGVLGHVAVDVEFRDRATRFIYSALPTTPKGLEAHNLKARGLLEEVVPGLAELESEASELRRRLGRAAEFLGRVEEEEDSFWTLSDEADRLLVAEPPIWELGEWIARARDHLRVMEEDIAERQAVAAAEVERLRKEFDLD